MNALIITNTTAVRMNVIADRTQNLLIAGAKAMMIESLKEKLRSGVAHFIYIKRMVRCVRHGERPQRVWLKVYQWQRLQPRVVQHNRLL